MEPRVVQEQHPKPKKIDSGHPSPMRLRRGLEANARLLIGKITTEGLKNLEAVKGKKVVFVASHATDFDMAAAAYSLRNDFDLLITHQSVHTKEKEPVMWYAYGIAGRDNFFPIDYTGSGKEDNKKGVFNPDTYARMHEFADERGKAPLLAANSPTKNGELEYPGKGAVYYAQLDPDVSIVPVAVDLKEKKTGRDQKSTRVIFGEPMSLPHIPGIEELADLVKKGDTATDVELQRREDLMGAIKLQSDKILATIGSMLPEQRAGKNYSETGLLGEDWKQENVPEEFIASEDK